MDRPPLQDIDVDAALRTILEGTATETGEQFFKALVKNLAAALNTHGAWVTEYFPESRRLKALAFWMGEQWLEGWEMVVDGTPCERVIDERCLIHIPDNLVDIYGNDPDVRAVGAASYMGMPLLDLDGEILGHLAVLDMRPMPAEPRAQALFQIFAARAAAELRRLRAEAQVREREQKLGRLGRQRHGRDHRARPTSASDANESGGGKSLRLRRRRGRRPDLYPFFDSRLARKAGALDHRSRYAAGRTAVIYGFPAVSRRPTITAAVFKRRRRCRVSISNASLSTPSYLEM